MMVRRKTGTRRRVELTRLPMILETTKGDSHGTAAWTLYE